MKKLLLVATLLFLDLFIMISIQEQAPHWLFLALFLASLSLLVREFVTSRKLPLFGVVSTPESEACWWMATTIVFLALKLFSNNAYLETIEDSSLGTENYYWISTSLPVSLVFLSLSIGITYLTKGKKIIGFFVMLFFAILFALSFFFFLFMLPFVLDDGWDNL